MPSKGKKGFRSERQRRYLWANLPHIARRWAHKYGTTAPDTHKYRGRSRRRRR